MKKNRDIYAEDTINAIATTTTTTTIRIIYNKSNTNFENTLNHI